MIPTKTNNPSPCSPLSSNCVIWQGPDIACINICNGDTISDVVAALATKLCAIIDEACECDPDLTGLDLKCTLPAEGVPADLMLTLQAMIDYICTLPTTAKSIADTMISLPPCLQYVDRATGNPVVELSLEDWAQLVSNTICEILNDIAILQQSVLNLKDRVQQLEETVCYIPCSSGSDFNVIPTCVLSPGIEVPISSLVLAIETQFCNLRDAVGSVGAINTAISAQCLSATDGSLAANGASSLGDIIGWVANPSTLADSNVNQWLAICDLYAAVTSIQTNCCSTDCDKNIFSFTYSLTDSTGDGVPDFINLNFMSSVIPVGFTDCGGSTLVTVTDSTGSSITENIIVSNLVTAPGGTNIDITTLNRLNSLTITIDFCVTDGVSQCAETQSQIIPLSLPCPSPITATAGIDSFVVSFTNALGSAVSYEIVATNPTTGAVFGQTTIANPALIVSHSFTGATAGQTYDVQVTVSSSSGSSTTCASVSVTVLGTTCTDVECTTSTVAADPITTEYYLGIHSTTQYWYNPTTQRILTETGAIACNSATLSVYSMDTSGTPGEITVTTAYGASSGTDIVLSYSTDGLAYTGATSGGIGVRTLATGTTSGSVYLKATVTCSGPVYAVPTILRYDFNTATWTVIQDPDNCASTSLTAACPAGIEVAQQYLDCGDNRYSVFGGAANSYWFYVGKYVDGTVTRYLYAGWDNTTNAVRSVVECCACPTFILTDPIQILVGNNGGARDIIIPYVLGAGEPSMTVILNPVLGAVVQDATIKNKFTYTSTTGQGAADYADTFQVQLEPTIAGTGSCELAVATVQIQLVNCEVGLKHTNQDVYAFINTNGYSVAEGTQIKAGLTALIAQWVSDFTYTGNLYFIPTDSKRWLGYLKSIADDGASWLQSVDLAWQALEDLPTSWPGESGVGVWRNAAFALVFSNESSSIYHDATLAAGFGSQPTTSYKEDYDAYYDMINGTMTSAWGLGLGITEPQFPEDISTILYPLMTPGSGGVDAANILQMIAAYTGELITPSKYGIATSTDVTSFMLQGSAALPYTGATTPGGNTLQPLFWDVGEAGMLALLNQDNTTDELTEIAADTNEQFIQTLTQGMESCGQEAPSTAHATTGVIVVEVCAGESDAGDAFIVTITAPAAKACGSLANGLIFKLTNSGATYTPGDGRSWAGSAIKCVKIIDNCTAYVTEMATMTMGATYVDCATCV